MLKRGNVEWTLGAIPSLKFQVLCLSSFLSGNIPLAAVGPAILCLLTLINSQVLFGICKDNLCHSLVLWNAFMLPRLVKLLFIIIIFEIDWWVLRGGGILHIVHSSHLLINFWNSLDSWSLFLMDSPGVSSNWDSAQKETLSGGRKKKTRNRATRCVVDRR